MSWLIDTLIATGALIALVLAVRRPVARLFGPGMAYALWALPLLRLVLPPLVLPAAPEPVTVTVTPATIDIAGPLPVPVAAAWPHAELAAALWLAGALAFLGWRVWSYHQLRRSVLAAARPVGEAGSIRLVESPAVPGPVAFGLRDKVIALPPGFMASEDRAARDLAIAHELEHHAGRDIAVNFAMQPLLALHWFNPLAWLGWKAMRRDQEAACDARVLAGRCAATRAAYARLIAGYAQGQHFALAAPLACPVVGEKSVVHRLRSLTMTQPSLARRRIGRLLIGAAALALPLTATITYASSEPVPPAPPASPAAPDAPKHQVEKHVVVIKHLEGEGGKPAEHGVGQRKIVIIDDPAGRTIDDKTLHTRVIERDGRTIVLKTREPVTEDEALVRIALAEASMAEAETSILGEHGSQGAHSVAVFHRQGSEKSEVRTIKLHGEGGDWTGKGDHEAQIAMVCGAGKVSEAHAATDKDGKKQVVRIKLCAKGGDMAEALSGLRKARDKVAGDSNLSGEIRAEVLKQLDAEIARLAKES